MDATQLGLLIAAIGAAGAGVGAVIKWAVSRVVKAVDENTAETKLFGAAISSQKAEMAVLTEAFRGISSAVQFLLMEVGKLNAKVAVAMRLPTETEPPPISDRKKGGTPIQGVPISPGTYHIRKRTEPGDE